jgi:chemotaxis protein CheX
MDANYINPFLEALQQVLAMFGVAEMNRSKLEKKDNMHVDKDITAIVGMVGDVRGNIAYSFSRDTAKQIVGAMVGMTVNEIDAIARSGIGEFANMVTGTAMTLLGESGNVSDITPPSIVFGEDLYMVISSVQTIAVEYETGFGKIEVNIGLEM